MQKYKAIKVEHQWQVINGDTLIAIAGCDNSAISTFDVPEEWEEDVEKLSKEYANNNFQSCSYHYENDDRITDFDTINKAFKAGYLSRSETHKWTDKDMIRCWETARSPYSETGFYSVILFLEFISQPKEYEVELEEEELYMAVNTIKITNNKVKILTYKLL